MNPFILLMLLSPCCAFAQLAVSVSPVKTTGQKAIVSLAMKNNFTDPIESVRAICFLLDAQGKFGGPIDEMGNWRWPWKARAGSQRH